MVTLPDVVVERKSTRGEAALHVAVSKTSSTRRRHRRSEKDFERRRSSLIVGFSHTVSPAAPAGASRPRKPRRSATKEEKVGGGGGGVGERVVVDPRHRDRVRGRRRWEEVVVGVGV